MKFRDPNTGHFKDLNVKVSDTFPIGATTTYGGTTLPAGWLVCDGSAVSRTDYQALFNVIGTTYGEGDGSTTFNLPDYLDDIPDESSKYIIKANQLIAVPSKVIGENSASTRDAYSAKYNNDLVNSINTATNELINNTINTLKETTFPIGKIETFFDNNDHSHYLGFTWERVASGRTLVGINTADSSFNAIGKTGGAKTHTLTINEMPSHNHKMPIDSFVNSDSQQNTITGGHVSNETEGTNYNTTSTGGGQPHSIMGPYIVVAFWKRIR
jgi:microcystin-dependent protein